MSPAAAALITSLLEPLPGPSPCGVQLDVDSEDDLLWLQDQIEKTTAFGEGEIDWAGILRRSTRLLSERSKDWALVCYAARAMYHGDGLDGLAAGLEVLKESAQRYWKQMHPAIPSGLRKRANLLDWLITGLADDLARRSATAGETEAIQKARGLLKEIDALLAESLGAAYPGVRLLRDALERQEAMAQPAEPAAAVETAPASEAAAAPVAVPAAEFPPPIGDADTADAVLSKCRQGLFAACDALQAADGAAPRPYRLRRLAAWMNFDGALPSEEGRIGAVGPDAGEAERLRSVLGRDAKGVLDEAESRLSVYPLWLDLQQLAGAALARLGPSHEAAREAVRAETAALLRRVPGLCDLAFANGAPLADATTRAWIEEELGETAPADPRGAPAQTGEGPLAQAVSQAGELAGRGAIEESLEVFDKALHGLAGGRERFLWRLAAARHLARVGQAALALDLLESLDREAAAHGLETWEPDLCAEVLQAVLQVGKKGRGKKGPPAPLLLERMPELTKRLARFDLVAALRLSKER